MRASKLLVVLVAALVLAAGPALAHGNHTVSVTHDDDGTATVTVTDNGTAVADANVTVTVTDENKTYDGAGIYTTDADGTVTLPEPNETVNVSVVAEINGTTNSTTAMLEPAGEGSGAADEPFGLRLTGYMETLNNSTDEPRGVLVANWVLENNPGNAPDHAGPPSHAGEGKGNGQANGHDTTSGAEADSEDDEDDDE